LQDGARASGAASGFLLGALKGFNMRWSVFGAWCEETPQQKMDRLKMQRQQAKD